MSGDDDDPQRDLRGWVSDHRRGVIVVAILAALAAPAGADAAVSVLPLTQTSGDITYQNDQGFALTEADPSADQINGSVLFNSSDPSQIRFVTNDGNVTFRANGSGSGQVDTLASRTTVSDLNVSATTLEIDPAGERAIGIRGAADSVEVRDQDLSDEEIDVSVSSPNGKTTLEVPLANETGVFAVKRGTDEILDRDVAVNGSANLALPSGSHDVEIRRGGTVTVFNESDPTAGPLSGGNLSLTVSVFSNDRVVSSGEVTNGRFALAGLEGARGPFLVTVTNDGFVSRTIIVDSLFANASLFLLPTSENRVETRFALEDTTGKFGRESSIIFVDKIINQTDGAQYRTVRSGPSAPDGELTTILDQGETYRLRVADGDGNTRVLGTYQAQSAQTVTLSIGQIEFQLENESVVRVGGERAEQDLLQFRAAAGSQTLDTVEVRIHELNNSANELSSTTQFDVNNVTITEQLSASEQNVTWVANYSVVVGSEELTGVVRFGGGRGSQTLGIPLDPDWKERFALGGILIVGTLFSAGNLRVGALVVPGLGGLLWLLGWLPPVTGAVSVGVSMTLGVIYAVGVRGGGP